VRVLEPCGELYLTLEALGAQRFGNLSVQDLERDRTVVPEVVGEVHDSESPPTEFLVEAVAVLQGDEERIVRCQNASIFGDGDTVRGGVGRRQRSVGRAAASCGPDG
jgi:hypothetical protein